jgi:hypothetical protein
MCRFGPPSRYGIGHTRAPTRMVLRSMPRSRGVVELRLDGALRRRRCRTLRDTAVKSTEVRRRSERVLTGHRQTPHEVAEAGRTLTACRDAASIREAIVVLTSLRRGVIVRTLPTPFAWSRSRGASSIRG